MRSPLAASRNVVAIALVFGIGSGCAGTTPGCAAMKPLPSSPAPFGMPSSQVIEGGAQARLTQQGLKKFSTVIEGLLQSGLTSTVGCLIPKDDIAGSYQDTFGWITLCPMKPAACSAPACGASIVFDSTQRPAPWNFQDGVDELDFSMADGSNPVMNVTAAFDLDLPIVLDFGEPLIGLSETACTLELYTPHYSGDATTGNLSLTVPIQLGIDPTTGKLTLAANPIQFHKIDLAFRASNCGAISPVFTLFTQGFDIISSALNSQIGLLITNNFITPLLQPQVNALINGLLPNPLGIAGTIDTATTLASYSAPATAGLETYLVPGGYVSAKDKGLTIGVLAGMNSDHDETTRTDTTSSEPDPCVPSRVVPDLGGAPWNLPTNTSRHDFSLNAADGFAGNPDPVDASGNVRDFLLGISRSYFDLIGFHLYNSGSMCLHVDGSAITQLSTGTIGIVIPSLASISTNPKAPLELVLRPQTPPTFTIGAGTSTDALIHMAIHDLRIDMYAWVEERWVRVLTIGLDLALGIDLTVTKDASMNPALQPVLSGLDTSNVKVTVTNTDLLAEDPATLDAAFPSLIGAAAGALTGALPTFPLPAVGGFSLDDLSVERVQSGMDDFLGLFATVKSPTSPAPLIDWTDPAHPRLAGELRTHAAISTLHVPSPAEMAQLFDPTLKTHPALPSLTLALSADGANGGAVEYAWKVDGNAWRPWVQSATPTITDDAFLLQGHHKIQVRARLVGDYRSMDTQPVAVDALFDSVPPNLVAHLDDKDSNVLVLDGWDLVSDADHLDYSWIDNGAARPFSKVHTMTIDELGRLTRNGADKLFVTVRDEAGLTTTQQVDALPIGHASWGRPATTASGCGCDVGGQGGRTPTGALLVIGAVAAWLLSRRRMRSTLALLAMLATSATLVGCKHTKDLQCTVADDCAQMTCAAGKLPSCDSNQCGCVADLDPGQTGQFASMSLYVPKAYVAAYNQTYGDLMVGAVTPPGRVTQWDFVDGVPNVAPNISGSHVRSGIRAPGDDVGQYTSITTTKKAEPIVSYYDATNGALRFASFGAIRWHSHMVDQGGTATDGTPDPFGTWTSLTLDNDGKPGIAYSAIQSSGTKSGKPEGQLRFAQATTADPQSPADWSITIVDSRAMPDMPTATNDLLPDSIAIMITSARRIDGTPAIAYYDRLNGNLRYAEQSTSGAWTTRILDGETDMGTDTGDVGQYPSMVIDPTGTAYISYVDGSRNSLLFVDTMGLTPQVVDDGYRPDDEKTSDGLASPVYHLVGDSSSIGVSHDQVFIAYQDSTAVELRFATRDIMGKWTTTSVAGHADPFKGSYGFWAGLQLSGKYAYLGSYGINQQSSPEDYFYETFSVDLGFTDVQ